MRLIDADALHTALIDEYRGIAGYKSRVQFYRAIEIAQRQPTIISSPNDPLTLEELREMDGEKIFVHYIDGLYTDEDGAYFGKFEQLVRECNGKLTACELPLEYYGKTWLAYRRKPEEGMT